MNPPKDRAPARSSLFSRGLALVTLALMAGGCLAVAPPPMAPGAMDNRSTRPGQFGMQISGGGGSAAQGDPGGPMVMRYGGPDFHFDIGLARDTIFRIDAQVFQVDTPDMTTFVGRVRPGVRWLVVPGILSLGAGMGFGGTFLEDFRWTPDLEIGVGHRWNWFQLSFVGRLGYEIIALSFDENDEDPRGGTTSALPVVGELAVGFFPNPRFGLTIGGILGSHHAFDSKSVTWYRGAHFGFAARF